MLVAGFTLSSYPLFLMLELMVLGYIRHPSMIGRCTDYQISLLKATVVTRTGSDDVFN